MSNKKSIKINVIMNFILKISAFIFPLITYPYASRILEPDGMGKIAFATSIVTYFGMFASMGIPTYGIKACAKVRNNKDQLSKVVQEILIINAITLIATYIIFIIFIFNLDKMYEYRGLLLVLSVNIIFNVAGMEWIYSALEEYTYISIRSLVFKFIGIVLMFLCVHNKEDYMIYGLITIFASVGSNILNLINIRKFIVFKKLERYNLKRHFRPILILFASSIAISIYTNLDTVMLGYMTNDTEVGLYNTAIKFKQILVSLVISLGTVLLPRMSYYYENNERDKINNLIAKAIHFTLILSIGVSTFFIMYSKESILFLAGESYLGALYPMIVVTSTIPIIGLACIITNQILIPADNEVGTLIATCIGAITNIALNIILIPKFGALGAAIGTLGAEIVGLISQLFIARNTIIFILKNINYSFTIIPTIISVLITSIVSKEIQLSSFMNVLIGAIVFFGTYISILLMMKESILTGIFRKTINKTVILKIKN